MKTTGYYENRVRVKRPDLKDEWCEWVLQHSVRMETQANGRIRHWAFIPELGHYLRVVTLADGETVHNAFPDSHFQR